MAGEVVGVAARRVGCVEEERAGGRGVEGGGVQACACGVVVCELPGGRGARQVKAMVATSTAKLTPPTPLRAVELISPSQK